MDREQEKDQQQTAGQRIWISIGLAILGLSLMGASMFVTDDPAHILLTRLIQILMTVSGSICVILAVILYFVRDNTDIHS